MKFIMNDLVYDTEKSEKIMTFMRNFRKEFVNPFTGRNLPMNYRREAVLYRTVKGKWFVILEVSEGKFEALTQMDTEVEELFKDLDKVELYEKYFTKLEEA